MAERISRISPGRNLLPCFVVAAAAVEVVPQLLPLPLPLLLQLLLLTTASATTPTPPRLLLLPLVLFAKLLSLAPPASGLVCQAAPSGNSSLSTQTSRW